MCRKHLNGGGEVGIRGPAKARGGVVWFGTNGAPSNRLYPYNLHPRRVPYPSPTLDVTCWYHYTCGDMVEGAHPHYGGRYPPRNAAWGKPGMEGDLPPPSYLLSPSYLSHLTHITQPHTSPHTLYSLRSEAPTPSLPSLPSLPTLPTLPNPYSPTPCPGSDHTRHPIGSSVCPLHGLPFWQFRADLSHLGANRHNHTPC